MARGVPRYDPGTTHRSPENARSAKNHCKLITLSGLQLAGEQGFEPQYRGPEPRVLPLDDSPAPLGRQL